MTRPTIEAVLASRSASGWLQDALQTAIDRDCCDAAADARLLADLLAARRDKTLGPCPDFINLPPFLGDRDQ